MADDGAAFVTAIGKQPTSPAQISVCKLRVVGDTVRFDIKLSAAAGITDVIFGFGLYDERFVLVDDFQVNGEATGSRTIYYRARFRPLGYDFSGHYARCEIVKVVLSDGTQWMQEPTYSHADWKGDPDR